MSDLPETTAQTVERLAKAVAAHEALIDVTVVGIRDIARRICMENAAERAALIDLAARLDPPNPEVAP